MPGDWQEQPKYFSAVSGVTTTPQVLFPAGRKVPISHVVIRSHTAGSPIAAFSGVGGSPQYFSAGIPAGSTLVLPGWVVGLAGLEVVSNLAVSAIRVVAFYYSPIALV